MKRRHFFKSVGAGSLAAFSPAWPSTPSKSESGEIGIAGQWDARAEVHLDRIVWNLAQLKKLVKTRVMAVVKANAYGHGIVDVSRALEKAGADCLMVGKLEEAVALREAGVRCPILNFGPFDKPDCAEIVKRNISQSVYTGDAAFLHEAALKQRRKTSVHIDIDTGMSRTGVSYKQALPLIEKMASFSHLKMDGIMTTLTEDPEFDREQVRRLLEVCSAAKKKGISSGLRHAASSAGILASPEFHLDMVRPGITLYGYYPNVQTQKEDALDLRPALKLFARVVFIKDLEPGDSASYHRVFVAQRQTRVATVGIGYSDGYPPQLGGNGSVLIRNKRFPVLNAVTSNHLMVELGEDRDVRIGDEVVLIDPDRRSGLTADVLAEQSGISDYKILIGLNPRLPRISRQEAAD
jgi:alanine racemase